MQQATSVNSAITNTQSRSLQTSKSEVCRSSSHRVALVKRCVNRDILHRSEPSLKSCQRVQSKVQILNEWVNCQKVKENTGMVRTLSQQKVQIFDNSASNSLNVNLSKMAFIDAVIQPKS